MKKLDQEMRSSNGAGGGFDMGPRSLGLFSLLLLLAISFAILISSHAARPPDPAGRVREFEFVYRAALKGLPAEAGRVEVWIPFPQSDANQEVSGVEIASDYRHELRRDPEYGNALLYFSAVKPAKRDATFNLKFKVKRREHLRSDIAQARTDADSRRDPLLKRFLLPDRLVPIDGRIVQLAAEAARGKESALEKARAIYDFTASNIKYDKSGTGWGRGDIYYACDLKRGNCSDFHAVFIGFCRALGIPARFEIGFPLPAARGEGEIPGYHCWAQFYLDGYGWIPVDCSEASKNPDKRDYFFGAHDENRVLFTIGRDILLDPPQKGARLNFFIYPYVEVDGEPFDGIEKKFYFRDLTPPVAF